MGWDTPNPYTDPAHFGLEMVTSAELSEPCYSFDTAIVWYHAESETFYWGHDSGCSCPCPFEYTTELDQLDSGTRAEAMTWLRGWVGEEPDDDDSYERRDYNYRLPQIADALEKLATFKR